MKLQQLRYVVEVFRHDLNVSDAAEALYTSQPGISKQIKALENELGVTLFERSGKRFIGVTEPGRAILASAARILNEAENLKRLGKDYAGGDSGSLVLALTHNQARYALPPILKAFVARYPKVALTLRQGAPAQIAAWLTSGDADIGIATDGLDDNPGLVSLPVKQWHYCAIAGNGHAILKTPRLTLQTLARHPLIVTETAGRSGVLAAFQRQGLEPQIALAALDADVIKTYVALGLGVGLIADFAYDATQDSALVSLDAAHLFESQLTRIGLRRGVFLRRFEYDFIQLFAPHLDRHAVERTLSGGGGDYQL